MVARLYGPPIPLGQLETELRERESRFHDTRACAQDIHIAGDGTLRLGGTEHRLQPQALDQIAGRVRVPASYLHRCPSDLVAANLNRWLPDLRDQDLLVRFDGDEVRAILSDRYQAVSNLDVVRSLLRSIPEDAPVRYEVGTNHFVAQVLTAEALARPGLHGGTCVGNSETGFRVVELRGFIYRTICLNGLILGNGETTLRRRHTHDAAATLEEVASMAEVAWKNAADLPGRLGNTETIRIPDVEAVLALIDDRYQLSPPQRRETRRAFAVEPGGTLFHVINAYTRAGNAAHLTLEERSRLQEVGGEILLHAERGKRWI